MASTDAGAEPSRRIARDETNGVQALSHQELEEGVVTDETQEEEEETEDPKKYKVLFHNDDYTTMEFVVRVLKRIFHKSKSEATEIMLKVHNSGSGVAGVYSKQIAETKVEQTIKWAREEGHPLMVTMEPE